MSVGDTDERAGGRATEPGAELVADLDLARVRNDVHARLFGRAPHSAGAPSTMQGDAGPPATILARGARVGRYVVLEPIGRGATAVVYAAYDPELDRKVALKLLRPRPRGSDGGAADARTRLVREAHALAKLSHPAVVTVHDAGIHGDTVFLAMERVEGPTLRAWLDGGPRSWVDVLRVLILAGRGLAAAHAAGILHRDFKPENVMLRAAASGDRADVACVTDFGLARTTNDDAAERTGADQPSQPATPLQLGLTETGALVGTPAYMAPEQFIANRVDERSDQFAFCVTVWEALFGARPFTGDSLPGLAAAVVRATPPRAPAGARVPRWLQRALQRGLARLPDDRWPSMDALLSALEVGRARARSRTMLAAAAGAVAVLGVGYGALALERRARVVACDRTGDEIAEVWNDERRAGIRARFVALDTPVSRATAVRLEPWLDEHAAAWAEARRESCVAAEVERSVSTEVYDAARWCLAERKVELAALVEGQLEADASTVLLAVTEAAGLAPIEPCLDAAALARVPTPDVVRRDAVAALAGELARVRVDSGVSDDDRADRLEALLHRAEALDWPPLTAAVRVAWASALVTNARADEAEAAATDAFHEAAAFGAWERAAEAAIQRARVTGAVRQRLEEGSVWIRLAETALALAPRRDDIREIERLLMAGVIQDLLARPVEARREAEAALELAERALGPEHPTVAQVLCSVGVTYRARSDYRRMRELCGRAHGIFVRTLGEQHPQSAMALLAVAATHYETGDHAEARALYERARAVYEVDPGPMSAEFANVSMHLGLVAEGLGEWDDARAKYLEALAIREAVLGPKHPRVAVTLRNLAEVEVVRGELPEARAHAERALVMMTEARGEGHAELTMYLHALARVREAEGAVDEALALYERALALSTADGDALGVADERLAMGEFLARIGDRVGARDQHTRALELREVELGPDHALVAESLTRLGELDLAEKRSVDARGRLERAAAIFEQTPGLGQDEHDADFGLAQALWTVDPARSRRLAADALAGHRAAPGDRPEQIAAITRWLARHPAP